MESFSERELEKVCGYTGIIQKQTYLPSPFQLREALEEAEKPYRAAEHRFRTALAMANERMEAARIAAERPFRPTYEQMIATLPESLRLNKAMPFSKADQEAFLAKYNVTKEEFDKLPDAKPQLSANPVGQSVPDVSPPVPSPEVPSDMLHPEAPSKSDHSPHMN